MLIRTVLIAGLCTVAFIAGGIADQTAEPKEQTYHQIDMPQFNPTVAENHCMGEALAYVDAVDELTAAQAAADEAYYAWMTCMNVGKTIKTADEQLADAPARSVLTTD